MENEKVNILGTEYELIRDCSMKDYPQLKDCYGFNDETVKKIIIGGVEHADNNDLSNLKDFEDKVVRHEIIHCFLNESGLAECSEWARLEEMVDFFARQLPKIAHVCELVNAMRGDEDGLR